MSLQRKGRKKKGRRFVATYSISLFKEYIPSKPLIDLGNFSFVD
jgi:hypothetical protein